MRKGEERRRGCGIWKDRSGEGEEDPDMMKGIGLLSGYERNAWIQI